MLDKFFLDLPVYFFQRLLFLVLFLKISLSTENLPLPSTKIIIERSKYTSGNVFTSNGSFACAIKKATDIVMKIGIIDKRVKKPTSTKKAQKNSAKITRLKDNLAPIPIISWNIGSILS